TLDQLHHNVEFAIGFTYFVDCANVWMGESGRSASLVKQILAGGRVKLTVFLNNFQGHVAVQHLVTTFVDFSHSSFTDLLDDTVMTDDLTDHRVVLPHSVRHSGENRFGVTKQI